MLAGELKHGPLALVDEAMPVILVMPRDRHYEVGRELLPQRAPSALAEARPSVGWAAHTADRSHVDRNP